MSTELELRVLARGSGIFSVLKSNEEISAFTTIAYTADATATIQDANASGLDMSKLPAVGISTGVIDNAYGKILHFGYVTNPLWSWTPGAILYQSDTDGQMSETAGTYEQQVAVAVTATTIFFWPKHVDYDPQI